MCTGDVVVCLCVSDLMACGRLVLHASAAAHAHLGHTTQPTLTAQSDQTNLLVKPLYFLVTSTRGRHYGKALENHFYGYDKFYHYDMLM